MTEGRQKRLQLSTKIFVNTENNSHSIQQKLRNTVSVFTTNKSLLQRGGNRCYKVTQFSVFLRVSCNIQSVHNSPHLKGFIGSWLFVMCGLLALFSVVSPMGTSELFTINNYECQRSLKTFNRVCEPTEITINNRIPAHMPWVWTELADWQPASLVIGHILTAHQFCFNLQWKKGTEARKSVKAFVARSTKIFQQRARESHVKVNRSIDNCLQKLAYRGQ